MARIGAEFYVFLGLVLALFLLCQALFSAPALRALLQLSFAKQFLCSFDKGFGCFLFFIVFRAKNFRLLFHGSKTIDRFYFESDQIVLWVNPFFLCLGKFRVSKIYLKRAVLHYFNRMDSYKKQHLLPKPGRFLIKNIHIRDAFAFIEDETMWPIYRLTISNIQIQKMTLDLACAVGIFFHTKKGSAEMADGKITVESSAKKGAIRLWGMRWNEVSSFSALPIQAGYLALVAHFQRSSAWGRGKDRLALQGFTGLTKEKAASLDSLPEQKISGIRFAFDMDLREYATTLDLGIQRLIDRILATGKGTWFSLAFLWSGRGIFKLMKKPES